MQVRYRLRYILPLELVENRAQLALDRVYVDAAGACGGVRSGAKLNIRPMCAVPDGFKHRIAACRQALQSSRPN